MIIIAGSGMCTGGSIKHHLVNNIERPESIVLFVGYQASGTLGRQIIGGAPNVRILGETYQVRAQVAQVHGFSAHADLDELLHWLTGLKQPPRQVFVTHGGSNVTKNFAAFLHEQTGWPAIAPAYRDTVRLD